MYFFVLEQPLNIMVAGEVNQVKLVLLEARSYRQVLDEIKKKFPNEEKIEDKILTQV